MEREYIKIISGITNDKTTGTTEFANVYGVKSLCEKCGVEGNDKRSVVFLDYPFKEGGYENLCTACLRRELLFFMIKLHNLPKKIKNMIFNQ
jgi:hypothetical protein